MEREKLIAEVFKIKSQPEFETLSLAVYRYQFEHNSIYRQFAQLLKRTPDQVHHYTQIPFLPIECFKNYTIESNSKPVVHVFESSGTTGNNTSKHQVKDLALYEKSFNDAFSLFYGDVRDYAIIGLLPGYLERQTSSLVYMVNDLVAQSTAPESGFYLNEYDNLKETLQRLKIQNKKVWLIGVSFALLDFSEWNPPVWDQLIVIETGGMKGRRREMVRSELHETMRKNWPVNHIHSEYGMTELFSQAYSFDGKMFQTPPWMQVLMSQTEDPLSLAKQAETGIINVIDLANIDSCAFIATQDLGKMDVDNRFEVLGRFDFSDARGCNLLINV